MQFSSPLGWEETLGWRNCATHSTYSHVPLTTERRTQQPKENIHMKIGIIGAGNIGATVAKKLAASGHDVKLANSRGPETIRDLCPRPA
ncbi:MAG TPA: NAD(P)-binding domain-containing protein [Eoetvoesiella sp.]